jgi:hypothetical protein
MSAMRSRLRLVILVSAAASCHQESCPCPSGGATVVLPTAQQSMVTKVTGDRCSDASTPPQDILLIASSAGTCHVRIELSNGQLLTTNIAFKPIGGCCPDTFFAASQTTPTLVDGGAD